MEASAPIRICDLGGWTDTWFAGHGRVLNLAVSPCVEVQVRVHPRGALPCRIALNLESFGDRYGYELGAGPGRHPLLEAVVDEIGLPDHLSVDIRVSSAAPVGASTGTSASAAVAMIGALGHLSDREWGADAVAQLAHRVETGRLGIESGIQDQISAALGGINYIEIDAYPEATVSRLDIGDALWQELERRLLVVYLGRPHVSSAVHERVIDGLAQDGGASSVLEDLRRCADDGRDALVAGDLEAFGGAMRANTDAQVRLHDDLVGRRAQAVIDVAQGHGALGWKVNGAGGEGGSVTVLCPFEAGRRDELVAALGRADPSFAILATRLSRSGLRVSAAPRG